MARILYSLSGDGRGHATRAHAILEALQARGHDITVFTFGQAFDYLAPLYRDTSVQVCRIGLEFLISKAAQPHAGKALRERRGIGMMQVCRGQVKVPGHGCNRIVAGQVRRRLLQ